MGLGEDFALERVFNTPLTEQGIVGFGTGLAATGHTAIAKIQFADYILLAFDQDPAKVRYCSGGQYNIGGLTVRTPTMSVVWTGGFYYSQSPEGFFMDAAGLNIVILRSLIKAKESLLSSIRDSNPVVFTEAKILYRSACRYQVPIDHFSLPLKHAETLIPGNDMTVLTWRNPAYHCEMAIHMLANPPPSIEQHILSSLRSIKTELIDFRIILPWNIVTVTESVSRTGRLVIVHEADWTLGVGTEISAQIQKRCFSKLDAPVWHVTSWE
ncbi:thiamine diphosphate-binding protein [Dendrothele bispora CBS 962.96]|nr:thiamine diphosphate-binding protein [Dendrothele bispora CBS 962.96]